MDFTFTPEQEELRQRARRAGEEFRPMAIEWDEHDNADLPAITKRMGEHGLLGLTMPAEYGGQDKTVLEYAIVVEELARGSYSGITIEPIFRTSGPGASICLMSDDEAPRRKFLRSIVSGEMGCSLALTELEHGSDAGNLKTVARKDGDDYVLNGSKRFITGAVWDELYAVFVRFGDIPGYKGVGTIMVEKGTPGFEVSRGHEFMGSRGVPHGDLAFDDCRVPVENVMVREGQFQRVMTAFNMERVHNAAFCLGLSEASFDLAAEYAQSRVQFGREIIEFQAIYHMLADMWTKVEALRWLTYRGAATSIDGKYPKPKEITIAKLFACQTLRDVSTQAMEIHGGDGTRKDFHIQRIHRDSLVAIVAGGTPQIARNVIASQLFPDHKFPQTRENAR